MANKYCITSGNVNDPSIWSDTNGGSGGASVPMATDNRYFNKSVVVYGFPSIHRAETHIGPDADVTWQDAQYLSTYGPLDVQGILRFTGNHTDYNFYDGSTLSVGEKGCIFSLSAMLIRSSISIDNRGSIQRLGLTTDGMYGIGQVDELLLISLGSPIDLSSNKKAVRAKYLIFNIITNTPITTAFESPIEIENVYILFNTSFTESITVNHYSGFRLTGYLSLSGLPDLTWNSFNALPTFFGTADQTINMPSSLSDTNWTVDKSAGMLYLVSYRGFLQGRLRKLIVGSTSHVDLDGVSPCLATSNSNWACYDGLKADATSDADLKQGWTVDDHLRESMDVVDNYGTIHIPSGKVICTKSFINRPGASVTGNGRLCIQEGGLANQGNIASTVILEWFDLDLSVTLLAASAVESGREYSAQISGSNVAFYRLDWGDGSFSESQTAGILSHVYANSPTDVFRTLTLTAKSGEGKIKIETKNIVVQKTSKELSVTRIPEIEKNRTRYGVPRGHLPLYYRYTLAQGVCYMPDTMQLFCPMNESGRAVENGSALLLGRITHSDGRPVSPSEILSASYTIYRLDENDPSVRIPVDGHTERQIDVSDILQADLILDENWAFDGLGYNFRHVLDDSVVSPFPKAGRNYLVDHTLFVIDAPSIRIQYRVHVV